MITESQIEKAGVKYAREKGWLARKASSPGQVGVHDQIFHKDGNTFYIEFKAPGKFASPKQLKFAQELRAAGIPTRCCDNIQKARDFIDKNEMLIPPHPVQKLLIVPLDISSFYPAEPAKKYKHPATKLK